MTARFDFGAMAPRDRYKMLCAAVIPRPVAWITSVNPEGVVNAAPFSFFNVFGEDPALVIIGINRRDGGAVKDTVTNIEAAGAFTVNIADTPLVDAMVETAAAFPPDVSEPEAVGLALEPGVSVAVPRIAAAPVSLECTLFELKALGPERHLVMGEVSMLLARDGLFDETTMRIDEAQVDPVARLYGTSYAALGEIYARPIPQWETLTKKTADGGA